MTCRSPQIAQQPIAQHSAGSLPYVATDLSLLPLAGVIHPDVLVEGRVYRRLSPDYFVWLRSRMEVARKKADQGLLPEDRYHALSERFNAMQECAIAQYGEEPLLAALATSNPHHYLPPSIEQAIDLSEALEAADQETIAIAHPVYPRGRHVWCASWHGAITRFHVPDDYFPCGWVEVVSNEGMPGQADVRCLRDAHGRPLESQPRFTADERHAIDLAQREHADDFTDLEASLPITAFPVAGHFPFIVSPTFEDYLAVNAIRDQALALGWTDADLFQTCGQFQFPCGQDYGLVGCVQGRAIGEVTSEAIALLPETSDGAVLRFHRPRRPVPPEVTTNEPICETLPKRREDSPQAIAPGLTAVCLREDAVCPVSRLQTGVQSPVRSRPAHAGVLTGRHRAAPGDEPAKRLPHPASRPSAGADHPCLPF
jgi:hypothetical protein